MKNLVKFLINMQKKEKSDKLNDSKNIPIEELYTITQNLISNLFNNSKDNNNNKIIEQNKIDVASNIICSYNKRDQIKILNIIRSEARNPEQRNILKKYDN